MNRLIFTRKIKLVLTVSVTILIVSLVAYYWVLGYFLNAIKTECNETKYWKIAEYKINERRCIGFAGPPFYRYDIYKKDKLYKEDIIKSDSCTIKQKVNDSTYLIFNLCEKSLVKLDN